MNLEFRIDEYKLTSLSSNSQSIRVLESSKGKYKSETQNKNVNVVEQPSTLTSSPLYVLWSQLPFQMTNQYSFKIKSEACHSQLNLSQPYNGNGVNGMQSPYLNLHAPMYRGRLPLVHFVLQGWQPWVHFLTKGCQPWVKHGTYILVLN